jgi:hypothetical protein
MKKTADSSETSVNLELLFNALLADSKVINDVLSGKK